MKAADRFNCSGRTDGELCGMISAGGAAGECAFTELYGRYSNRIHAYCYRILNGTPESEDVFQETFARFHRAVMRGQAMPNPSGYLFKTAKNLSLNVLKSRSRWVMSEVRDEDVLTRDTAYERTEMLAMITTALETLDYDFKEAFVLREYDGLSYAEVAEVMGITLATAKIRVFRAKQKIRKVLEPYLKDMLMV